jgi:N-acetylglucosaminyl-diphospho-decaprenol L-rhamnosyltransferase
VNETVDVAIVAYRCRDLIRECLLSLREHAPSRPTTVHVVDNDSRDGTAELVRDEFPEVKLVREPRNAGFAAATNRVIRETAGDYVLALNPDTKFVESTLDPLVDLMEAHPEIGICGCRLEREDGSFDHAAKRSFPTPLSALGHFTRVGRRPNARGALAAYRAPSVEAGPVDAVNGAFMLIRRRALDDVGLFDEGYWMYMEDLDLCYRFAEHGWTTWFEPSVRVVHMKGGSSGHPRPARLDVAFHYGMYRFYRKHYAATRAHALNGTVYVGIALKLAASLAASAVARSTAALARG